METVYKRGKIMIYNLLWSFICPKNKEKEKKAIEKIIKQVEQGKIKEGRINRSVKRIIKAKQKYGISDEMELEGIDIETVNTEIKRIRNLCGLE